MKKQILLGSLVLCAFGSSRAAAPVAPEEQLVTVLREVHAQQTQILENQAKIDAKLATVGEAVRIARIFASRGGK